MISIDTRHLSLSLLILSVINLSSCRQSDSLLVQQDTMEEHIDKSGVTELPFSLPAEFRGAWIATVANIDWPSRPGLSSEEQQQELIRLLDRAAALHFNAVIFQVRPAADAFYDSPFEPWSPWLTGTMGQAPEPFYDPMQFAITEAHKRGLELHAWFNPFRAGHSAHRGSYSEDHISVTHPHLVHRYGDFLWLDPGFSESREHTKRVILDVVRRYDIDAVHFDDYFYPYPSYADGESFPDSLSWSKASRLNASLTRDEWRRENVNQLIQDLADSIREIKPHVRFGISPFGIWRPGFPNRTAGFDSFAELHADARLWLNNGWVDYFSPQIYYTMDQIAQPFPIMLNWWNEENRKQRHLWPGLYTSRLWTENRIWPASEIIGQIYTARAFPNVTGTIHFSMKTFMQNSQEINQLLSSGPYALPAAVPASPWLTLPLPEPPLFSVTEESKLWSIRFSDHTNTNTRNRALQIHRNGESKTLFFPASENDITFTNHHRLLPDSVSVYSLNSVGSVSDAVHHRFSATQSKAPFSDPSIISRSTWSRQPVTGIRANAILLNGARGDTLRFETLSLTLNSMIRSMPFPERLLKFDSGEGEQDGEVREIVNVTLQRGAVSETLPIRRGHSFNWYGYHISLLNTDFDRELARFEIAPVAGITVSRAAMTRTGDHRQRFRIPHHVNRIYILPASIESPSAGNGLFTLWLQSLLKKSLEEDQFADVPYHYFISPDGEIFEGRSTDISGELKGTLSAPGAILVSIPPVHLSDREEAELTLSDTLAPLILRLMEYYGIVSKNLCIVDTFQNECLKRCSIEKKDVLETSDLKSWLRCEILETKLFR